jgi:hypothetical protein
LRSLSNNPGLLQMMANNSSSNSNSSNIYQANQSVIL